MVFAGVWLMIPNAGRVLAFDQEIAMTPPASRRSPRMFGAWKAKSGGFRAY
jgi:hypothetical protein